jgi:PleD family two-component response regulator
MDIDKTAIHATSAARATALRAFATPPEPEPANIDVLVLDDSQFDAMCILRECRRTELPVRVTIATNMDHFRELLSKQRYHLVFIDYMLPDGDGLAAQQILRDGEKNGQSPVVMISGEARHDVAVQAMKGGCIDYKSKTDLTKDALKSLILRALEEGSKLARSHLDQSMALQKQDIVAAIRDVLREEMSSLAMTPFGAPEAMRRMLQSYGLIPEGDGYDWSQVLDDPAANFVFRTH